MKQNIFIVINEYVNMNSLIDERELRIKHQQEWIEKKNRLGLDDPEKMKQYLIERHRKESKIYYEKHKEKISEREREYRLINKEKILEKEREYRLKNIEKISEREREYRLKNKEKISEYKAEYCHKNKDKIKEQKSEKIFCIYCHNHISRQCQAKHKRSDKHIQNSNKYFLSQLPFYDD